MEEQAEEALGEEEDRGGEELKDSESVDGTFVSCVFCVRCNSGVFDVSMLTVVNRFGASLRWQCSVSKISQNYGGTDLSLSVSFTNILPREALKLLRRTMFLIRSSLVVTAIVRDFTTEGMNVAVQLFCHFLMSIFLFISQRLQSPCPRLPRARAKERLWLWASRAMGQRRRVGARSRTNPLLRSCRSTPRSWRS